MADWLRSDAINPALNRLPPVWLTEVARLLPEMLSEHPSLQCPAPLTEDTQRQVFFEALARAILITNQPLILMIDDLQWCDRETHEWWLHYLLRFGQDTSLLIIATVRTGEPQLAASLSRLLLALRSSGQLSEIKLESLDEVETRHLAESLEDHSLDPRLQNYLYQETEGNPLFVVEYMRAGLSIRETCQYDSQDSGQKAGASAVGLEELPQKVQAVIQARLGQLHLMPEICCVWPR